MMMSSIRRGPGPQRQASLRDVAVGPRRGAAAIEFVLTLPVLVLMLFGTIEFGNYFSNLITVTSAAQDAVRFGARATTQAQAVIQTELAIQALIDDLAFDCSAGAGCIVDATMVSRSGINYVQLEVRVPYVSLTGAAPGEGSGGVEVPLNYVATATYPHVGASLLAP